MARLRAWRSWSRFCASLKAPRLSNHLAASISAATPTLVRPSSSTTLARITASVARVTVMTPKRNGRRNPTSRSKHSTAASLSLVMRGLAPMAGFGESGLLRNAGDIVGQAARRVSCFIDEHVCAHRRVEPQRAEGFRLTAVVETDLEDGRGAASAGLLDMNHRGLPHLHVERLVGVLDLPHQEQCKQANRGDGGRNHRHHAPRPIPPKEGVEPLCLVLGKSHASSSLHVAPTAGINLLLVSTRA